MLLAEKWNIWSTPSHSAALLLPPFSLPSHSPPDWVAVCCRRSRHTAHENHSIGKQLDIVVEQDAPTLGIKTKFRHHHQLQSIVHTCGWKLPTKIYSQCSAPTKPLSFAAFISSRHVPQSSFLSGTRTRQVPVLTHLFDIDVQTFITEWQRPCWSERVLAVRLAAAFIEISPSQAFKWNENTCLLNTKCQSPLRPSNPSP